MNIAVSDTRFQSKFWIVGGSATTSSMPVPSPCRTEPMAKGADVLAKAAIPQPTVAMPPQTGNSRCLRIRLARSPHSSAPKA